MTKSILRWSFADHVQAAVVVEIENTASDFSNQTRRSLSEDVTASVLTRLEIIESMLGIQLSAQEEPNLLARLDEDEEDPSLSGLWEATANLRRFTSPKNAKIWSRSVVKQLWVS